MCVGNKRGSRECGLGGKRMAEVWVVKKGLWGVNLSWNLNDHKDPAVQTLRQREKRKIAWSRWGTEQTPVWKEYRGQVRMITDYVGPVRFIEEISEKWS